MASTQAGIRISGQPDVLRRRSGEVRPVSLDRASWDASMQELGGKLHQSWSWGELQRRHGRQVVRLAVTGDAGTAMAQVLFKPHGPICTASIPRGPLVGGDAEQVLPELWRQVETACRRHRAIWLQVEPERDFPYRTLERWTPSFDIQRYSPQRTVIVPLTDDESLLKQMHSSKRREIRRAKRDAIQIERGDPSGDAMDTFYGLMIDTSTRNQVRISPKEYYADALRVFADDAVMMFAVADGKVAAGLIAARFGDTAIYLFGGSSTAHRVSGATALLQYSAMRWAREQGCARYDLGGIPDEDPPAYVDENGNPIRSVGNSDAGLYRFKVEFGGEIVGYPPAFEIRYRPGMSWAMRRLKELGNAARR